MGPAVEGELSRQSAALSGAQQGKRKQSGFSGQLMSSLWLTLKMHVARGRV